MRLMRAGSLLQILLVTAVATAAGCNPRPPDDTDYVASITQARAQKETFLRTDKESPIPENQKSHFLPLVYYPIDPAFKVPARLSPAPTQEVIEMQTSTGTIDKLLRAGTLEFTLNGQPHKLSAFIGAGGASRLFVPFRDTTAGEETYGAGRYLEIDRMPSGIYQIDFNNAFNPYCYFNLSYVCPLPPKENRLPIAITAGERVKDAAN
jgi:uncharacterized protein (DUF1684 family)